MRTIEAKTGVAKISAYCWRHTFITDCLAKGMSPTVVAELVGNSQRMVLRYYAHPEQKKKDALREAAARAVS